MANAGVLGQTNGLSNIGERLPSGFKENFRFFSDDARTTLYISESELVISEMPAGVYSFEVYEQTFSETQSGFAQYLKSKFALSTLPSYDSVEFVARNIYSYAVIPGYYNSNYPYERAHLSKDGNMVAIICALNLRSGNFRFGLICLFKVDGVWDLANSFFTEIQDFGNNSLALRSGLTVSTDGDFLAVTNRLFKVGATTLTEIELPPTIDEGIVAISVGAKIIATQREMDNSNSMKHRTSLYQLQNQSYTLFQRISGYYYPRGAFGAFSKSGEFFYMNGRVFRKSKNNTYIGFLDFDQSKIDMPAYYQISANRPSISDTGHFLWFLGYGYLQCDLTKGSFGTLNGSYKPVSVSSTVFMDNGSKIYSTPVTPDGVVYKVPDDVKIATVKVFIESGYSVFVLKLGTTSGASSKLPDNSCIVLSSGDCLFTDISYVDKCLVTGIEHV